VELLVVIVILAMLASLVTVAGSRAMTAARNAAIKAEIDMLHMALMNYKNEYGSFPPAIATIVANGTDPASKHLQRLFPRLVSGSAAAVQASYLPYLNNNSTFPAAAGISPDTALVAWLYGFNDDPTAPVLSTNGFITKTGGTIAVSGTASVRQKLFNFDTSRISAFQYLPSGKKSSPFIYIPSFQYKLLPYITTTLPTYGAHRLPTAPPATNTVADFAYATLFAASTAVDFANPDTFQILCAGRDEVFGNDDDLSNFWPGTRKDYLDSLNQ
jgi:type II secretory pathway pseudopilin PulG